MKRIRVIARTAENALAIIERELGSNLIILSTRRHPQGVEVMAGLDMIRKSHQISPARGM